MLKMFTSASRMVLILITVTVCAGFLIKILADKDFIILASMVFAFYFTKTGIDNSDTYTK